jgi:hypothetical protein
MVCPTRGPTNEIHTIGAARNTQGLESLCVKLPSSPTSVEITAKSMKPGMTHIITRMNGDVVL